MPVPLVNLDSGQLGIIKAMFAPASIPTAALSALRIDYRDAALSNVLQDPQLLAVFGFGTSLHAGSDDPRYAQVALPSLNQAPLELWRVNDIVQHGYHNDIAFSQGGGLQFCRLEVAEDGDIEAAATEAYTRFEAWLAESPYTHPLRIWNYLDAITEGEGDAERYRRFCVGRASGIGRAQCPHELPAATAIGHPTRSGRFQLYWLASTTPGIPLENPRQVQAWRYPREYGPQAPGFARALLPASHNIPLLLSGTAAVVGHASQHDAQLDAQMDEVLTNLQTLIDTARVQRPGLSSAPNAHTLLKVYVRDADAMAHVDALLELRLPGVPRIVLHGHVCRRELLVEIDGCHG